MTRQKLSHSIGLGFLIALAVMPGAAAQAPRRDPTTNDSLKSPEVLFDQRVTFRIYAPKAGDVTLRGDWMEGSVGEKLNKDTQGIWSLTVGPLVPDFYSYSFTVDGVRTIDPKNATIKQGISSLDSMFQVPGERAAFEENQPVPHGNIRIGWYRSSTLEMQRRLHIYTPPGYDSSRDRYPVLYLLHGGGDEDSGWSTIGRAGFILDNLVAQKKAKPMIIVMPNGSLPRPTNFASATAGAPPDPGVTARMQERFTNELLKDVIPYVEENYRVRANPQNRAIAGLSMGGGQTLRVVARNPNKFAYVAIWSAGVGQQNTADFEQRNAAFLENSTRINKQMKLLSICAGEKDFALAGSKNLSEMLNNHGIKHDFHLSGGGHTWINWRQYLNEFAPLLFR